MASLGLDKLNLTAKFLIGAILCVMLAAMYYLMFYADLEQKIENAQLREGTLQRDLADARQAEQAYQRDLAELAERQQRQAQLAKLLPNTTEYPAFLSSLQTVANVSGVALTSWAPQPERAEQFYARVPMALTLEGRYHQIAKFFHEVGHLDRIINMEDISIRDPQVKDKDVIVKVTAMATAFRAITASAGPSEAKRPGGAAP